VSHYLGEELRLLFCEEPAALDPLKRRPKPLQDAIRLFLYGMGPFGGVKDNTQEKFYFHDDLIWKTPYPDPHVPPESTEFYTGPKVMSYYASNGSDWMQTWALAYEDVSFRSDRAAPTVSLPSRIFGRKPPEPKEGSDGTIHVAGHDVRPLVAQAEFYFDCDATWRDLDCNRAEGALYRMDWRARLRRIHDFNLWGDLFDMFFDNALTRKFAYDSANHLLERWIGNYAVREAVVKVIRTDIVKAVTKQSSGDLSSHEMLH
jgi:hypothetical protein